MNSAIQRLLQQTHRRSRVGRGGHAPIQRPGLTAQHVTDLAGTAPTGEGSDTASLPSRPCKTAPGRRIGLAHSLKYRSTKEIALHQSNAGIE